MRLEVKLNIKSLHVISTIPTVWVCYTLEAIRWIIGTIGFVFAISATTSPEQLLHSFAPFLLVSLAGSSGIEDVFFRRCGPSISGAEPSLYQLHFGFFNLALAGVGVLSYARNWGPAADIALVTVLLVSTTLSTATHLWIAVEDGSFRLRSLVRAAGTVALIVVVLPMLPVVAWTLR